jgi:hypothetical protein
MSEISPNLALPYLLAAQAQKHVTVNEALRLLDGLVQLSVIEARSAPPAAPPLGARYLVTAPASSLWAGWQGSIALWDDNAWRRLIPQAGWLLWDNGIEAMLRFDGSAWLTVPLIDDYGSGEIEALGVAAAADATNRLAVAAPAVLLTHAGAGHQLKINKAAAGDTASVLFQTGFSGRAEMGLAGEDDFSFKVSANGTVWMTALRIVAATGRVQLPLGLTVDGGLGADGAKVVSDCNQATSNDYFSFTGSAANAPFGQSGALVAFRRSNGITQLAGRHNVAQANLLHARCLAEGGGWTAWREVFHQGNAVGTVSQASGVPTGAIIERGSNANGTFVRFADGTQICTKLVSGLGPVDIAFGSFFRSALIAYGPWAATFAAPPEISATATGPSGGGFQIVWAAHARPPSATGPVEGCLLRGTTSSATDFSMHFLAIGRWF